MPGVDEDGDVAVVTLLEVEPLPGVLVVDTALLLSRLPAVVVAEEVVVVALDVSEAPSEAPLLVTGELRLPNSDLLGLVFIGVSGVSKSGSNGSLTGSLSPLAFAESCPS